MKLYELKAGRYAAKFVDMGATLTSFTYTDEGGKTIDIVLGFDDLTMYEKPFDYLGATIGRFGNRIDAGRFTLDGKDYQLNLNDGANHLHGGFKGYDKCVWNGRVDGNSVEFTRLSPDGEENYPGNLTLSVTYTLCDCGELKIAYRATTDAPTLVNLTNHSFFNLNGGGTPDIRNHKVTINADHILDVDGLIPNGKVLPVDGTAFDLRGGKVMSDGMASGEPAVVAQHGYDHCFVPVGEGYREVARVTVPTTGLTLIVSTDLPGLQLYTGNFLNGSLMGRGGVPYVQYSGLCLESQYFPDAPNHPEFIQPVLRPGEVFESVTAYKLIKE